MACFFLGLCALKMSFIGPPPVPLTMTPAPVVVPTRPPPLTFSTLPPIWQCIAWHESTDNALAINPISGDAGAFQISQYMWDVYRTSNDPWWIPSASLEQQYQVAQTIQSKWGWSQWETAPLCGV